MVGTSYTRQSTFEDGDVVEAALFNDEYNQMWKPFYQNIPKIRASFDWSKPYPNTVALAMRTQGGSQFY